jgi:hypothetical protein
VHGDGHRPTTLPPSPTCFQLWLPEPLATRKVPGTYLGASVSMSASYLRCKAKNAAKICEM